MDRAQNIKAELLRAGSRFRPVAWNDVSKRGAPVIGWGIEEKTINSRRYIPRGFEGEIHPFKTKAEASEVCKRLTEAAQKGHQP